MSVMDENNKENAAFIFVDYDSKFDNSTFRRWIKDIFELRKQGLTNREIGKRFGFSLEQIEQFLKRERRKDEKVRAGIALKKKGRPPKDYVVREEDKVSELRYILARKEAKIKTLEMENELMRDFLSFTERK